MLKSYDVILLETRIEGAVWVRAVPACVPSDSSLERTQTTCPGGYSWNRRTSRRHTSSDLAPS
eukprot:766400-Hanusia_phi.AAC.2